MKLDLSKNEHRMEFACELAQNILEDLHFDNKLRYISFAEDIYEHNDDGTTYTEEAQVIFDKIYDTILNYLEDNE